MKNLLQSKNYLFLLLVLLTVLTSCEESDIFDQQLAEESNTLNKQLAEDESLNNNTSESNTPFPFVISLNINCGYTCPSVLTDPTYLGMNVTANYNQALPSGLYHGATVRVSYRKVNESSFTPLAIDNSGWGGTTIKYYSMYNFGNSIPAPGNYIFKAVYQSNGSEVSVETALEIR